MYLQARANRPHSATAFKVLIISIEYIGNKWSRTITEIFHNQQFFVYLVNERSRHRCLCIVNSHVPMLTVLQNRTIKPYGLVIVLFLCCLINRAHNMGIIRNRKTIRSHPLTLADEFIYVINWAIEYERPLNIYYTIRVECEELFAFWTLKMLRYLLHRANVIEKWREKVEHFKCNWINTWIINCI